MALHRQNIRVNLERISNVKVRLEKSDGEILREMEVELERLAHATIVSFEGNYFNLLGPVRNGAREQVLVFINNGQPVNLG